MKITDLFKVQEATAFELFLVQRYGRRIEVDQGGYRVVAYQLGNKVYMTEISDVHSQSGGSDKP